MRHHEGLQIDFDTLMGEHGHAISAAMLTGSEYLATHSHAQLLAMVGQSVRCIPHTVYPDKRWFQKSYGRDAAPGDDFLVGRGLFYLTEDGRLMLDCTAGHYQMTWGYEHPVLRQVLLGAIDHGVVWDNHSNIPAAPVKRLASKLIEIANPDAELGALRAEGDRLNTVLLGISTGSVACAAALKIMLVEYERCKARLGAPVFIALDGNYHGTDIVAQRLRGMWPQLCVCAEFVTVQPNDCEELERTFARWGERVAGFWAEPIMMNREAIAVDREYLRLARQLCDRTGALMALDEIQTGFWFPRVLMATHLGIEPDLLILGKGMTAGFNPLSALVYRGRLDALEQYDAISTNGNAALAAYMALACVALIEADAGRIGEISDRWARRMAELAAEFPETLVEARGAGLLSGLKFHCVEDALGFHRAATNAGLWLRVHGYHPGHSTILTKFALPLDDDIADFAVARMRVLLRERPWR